VIADALAALFTLFLVEPFEVRTREALAAARAPEAVVRDLSDCAARAAPALAARAVDDPAAAAATVVRLWMGTKAVTDLLDEVDPGCSAAIAAARRHLGALGAT
jgi:hypothetical protein